MTNTELLRILFAYVDEHRIKLQVDEESLEADQIALMWGPQSDATSPEMAVRQILEASRLNAIWLED